MKIFVALLTVLAVARARNIDLEDVTELEELSAYGYLTKFGIPAADEIRDAEAQEQSSRIIGGTPSSLGQFPYQVGIVIDLGSGSSQAVCGGTILTASKVLTAAHCWWDGIVRAWRFTIVAGSITLFTGGQRVMTSNVVMHASWNPILVRNDIAMVYLPSALSFSNIVAPIALPSGSELNEHFAGSTATVAGFGRTADAGAGAITANQVLRHVNLPVMTNTECMLTFPYNVVETNVCASTAHGQSTCYGDSGSPLVVTSNNRPLMIGIMSFSTSRGCEFRVPVVFTRVTSYISWINSM